MSMQIKSFDRHKFTDEQYSRIEPLIAQLVTICDASQLEHVAVCLLSAALLLRGQPGRVLVLDDFTVAIWQDR